MQPEASRAKHARSVRELGMDKDLILEWFGSCRSSRASFSCASMFFADLRGRGVQLTFSGPPCEGGISDRPPGRLGRLPDAPASVNVRNVRNGSNEGRRLSYKLRHCFDSMLA